MPRFMAPVARMLKRGWLRPVPLALLALAAAACQNPWIRVQNVGFGPANVTVTYYDENGQQVGQDGGVIDPAQTSTFALGGDNGVPSGFRGSAVVESDQPVVALRRTDMAGGSADMVDGDTITNTRGGSSLLLPLIMSHDGPWQTWNSRFSVQNVSGTATACVTISYVSSYTGQVVAWDPYKPGSGGSPQPGCPNGGRPIAPQASISRDPDGFGVPPGFTGAVRVDTVTNAQNVGPEHQAIAGMVDNWNSAFNLLTSYRGLMASELGNVTLLPLLEREVGRDNSYSTWFQVQSSDPASPVQVQLHVEGVNLDTGEFISRDNAFALTGARLCAQGADDDVGSCLKPGEALPPHFSGSGRIVSSAPVAVVVERGSYFYSYTNYRGVSSDQGATRIALPAVNDNSWLRLAVADGGGANVRIRYLGGQLDGGEASSWVSVNGALSVAQVFDPNVPTGFDGAAILESDRPIMAIVFFTMDGFNADRELAYNGVPIP